MDGAAAARSARSPARIPASPAAVVDQWQREPYEDRWSGSIIDEDDDPKGRVRAGDRWASVRNDDNGRELRIGERRAGVYSDGHLARCASKTAGRRCAGRRALTGPRWEDDKNLDTPRRLPLPRPRTPRHQRFRPQQPLVRPPRRPRQRPRPRQRARLPPDRGQRAPLPGKHATEKAAVDKRAEQRAPLPVNTRDKSYR